MTYEVSSNSYEWTAPSPPYDVTAGMMMGSLVSTSMGGIAVSEPTQDPILVSSQLHYFYAAYPGQLFMIDSSDIDDSKVIISWIPSWMAPVWATTLLYRAFSTSFTWAPWPEVGMR